MEKINSYKTKKRFFFEVPIVVLITFLASCNSKPIVVIEDYEAIKTGMSYAQVISIIGNNGIEISGNSIEGMSTRVVQWTNDSNSSMQVTFINDKVFAIAQQMLPRTGKNISKVEFTNQVQTDNDTSEQNPVPVIGWFPNLGELRGVTADAERHTFVVTPQIGYNENDHTILDELIRKQIIIIENLTIWFSSQKAKYLADVRNREQIRELLKSEVNKIINGGIDDLRFTNFQILNF